VDGEDYFFITPSRFAAMAENNALLEHATYVGNSYGTPRAYVEEKQADGWNVVLDIEVHGAAQVKEKEPEPVWKPYDLDSLREDNFTLGHAVVMRQKFIAKEPARIHTVMYLGHSENAENLNDVEILLGNIWFSVQRLLDDFEIFDDNYGTIGQPEWRPFGYQE
jgi:hypothetical protein